MRKFTIFTVILTIIIVVVVGELFVNDYLPKITGSDEDSNDMELTLPESLDVSNSGEASVLGADIDYTKISDLEYEEVSLDDSTDDLPLDTSDPFASTEYLSLSENTGALPIIDDALPTYPSYPASDSGTYDSQIGDFEDESYSSFSKSVFIREDQVKSAGFTGAYLESEPHNGFLYKTIYIDDLYDVEITKTVVRTDNSLFAKVYVFQVGPMSSVNEVYEVLKMRGAQGLDVEINDTNEFGDASFYLNDSRRSNVAFLTVRIGSLIYGFSYPKEYHSQIKNLITLIDLEF